MLFTNFVLFVFILISIIHIFILDYYKKNYFFKSIQLNKNTFYVPLFTHNDLGMTVRIKTPLSNGYENIFFDTGSPFYAISKTNKINKHMINHQRKSFQYGSGFMEGKLYDTLKSTIHMQQQNKNVLLPVILADTFKLGSIHSGIIGMDMDSKCLEIVNHIFAPDEKSFCVSFGSNYKDDTAGVLRWGNQNHLFQTNNSIRFQCFPKFSNLRLNTFVNNQHKKLTKSNWWQFPIYKIEVCDFNGNILQTDGKTLPLQAIADTGTSALVLPQKYTQHIFLLTKHLQNKTQLQQLVKLNKLPSFKIYASQDTYFTIHPKDYYNKILNELLVDTTESLLSNNEFIILGVPSFVSHDVLFDSTNETVTYKNRH